MKVTKIYIKKYLNFKEDLILDFTYPKNHPNKAEQPLEKICFIGQSSSGKSSLLNLIKYFSFEREEIDKSCIQESLLEDGNVEIFYRLDQRNFSKKIENGKFTYYENGVKKGDEFEKLVYSELSKPDLKPWLINFPFNVIENARGKSIIQFSQSSSEDQTIEKRIQLARQRNVWDFSVQNINDLWNIVFDEISIYLKNLQKEKDKFIDNVERDDANVKVYKKELDEWKLKNKNPIKQIADACLDEILCHLNLKTHENIDFENEDDLKFIKLLQKNNSQPVPDAFLSTGARQVLLTAIPLYYLSPKGSIILFDQPESSLYPDIQLMLIEIYQKLTQNSQFFFATHSPIIASSFNPFEIIELRFSTSNGRIEHRKFYKTSEENGQEDLNPQLLPWDLIYMKFFGLRYSGHPLKRKEAIDKLKDLKSSFEEIGDDEKLAAEKQKKLEEIREYANNLGINLRDFFIRNGYEEN